MLGEGDGLGDAGDGLGLGLGDGLGVGLGDGVGLRLGEGELLCGGGSGGVGDRAASGWPAGGGNAGIGLPAARLTSVMHSKRVKKQPESRLRAWGCCRPIMTHGGCAPGSPGVGDGDGEAAASGDEIAPTVFSAIGGGDGLGGLCGGGDRRVTGAGFCNGTGAALCGAALCGEA